LLLHVLGAFFFNETSTCSLSQDNYTVAFSLGYLTNGFEKAIHAVHLETDFRDETYVNISTDERSSSCHKSTVLACHSENSNTVLGRLSLYFSGVNELDSFFCLRRATETPVEVREVVAITRYRDSDEADIKRVLEVIPNLFL
jgi:hypothetical protein